jgi:hypothetical protein
MTTSLTSRIAMSLGTAAPALLLGGIALAAPFAAFADYGANNNYYDGYSQVCSSRFDPNCITKETNYLNQQQSYGYQNQYSNNYNSNYYGYNRGYSNYWNQSYQQPSYYNSYSSYNYKSASAYNSYYPYSYSYYSQPTYTYGNSYREDQSNPSPASAYSYSYHYSY